MPRTTDADTDRTAKTTAVPAPTQHEAPPISTESSPSKPTSSEVDGRRSVEESLETETDIVVTVTKTVKTIPIEQSVEHQVAEGTASPVSEPKTEEDDFAADLESMGWTPRGRVAPAIGRTMPSPRPPPPAGRPNPTTVSKPQPPPPPPSGTKR